MLQHVVIVSFNLEKRKLKPSKLFPISMPQSINTTKFNEWNQYFIIFLIVMDTTN